MRKPKPATGSGKHLASASGLVLMACLAFAGAAQAQTAPIPEPEGVAQTTPLPSQVSPADNDAGGPPRPTTPLTGTPDSGTQVYDATFFAQFSLTNAEDMLRRIPGVSALLDGAGGIGQGQGRGLGQGGEQILIDGKRMAAKSQGVNATLRRIPGANVERVELIRATSGEVASEGLLINIVLKPGTSLGGVGNYEINYRSDDGGWEDWDGLLSYSSTIGSLGYVVSYEKLVWTPLGTNPTGGMQDYSRRVRDEVYFYPSGTVQQQRRQKWERQHHRNIFSANLTYDFANGDQARINSQLIIHPTKEIDITGLTRFSTAGIATSRATEFHKRNTRRDSFELGGELDKKIGPGALSVIAIHSWGSVPVDDFRNTTETTGVFIENSRSEADVVTTEDVVRTSYAWPLRPNQNLTLGFEGARNKQDQELAAFLDTNGDFRLDPINIPTAQSVVTEDRGEIFGIHNWRMSGKLTLESSLSFEVSRIKTNYPNIPVETYKFPKPRFDLRYAGTPNDRLRLKVERTISQLSFANFVPAYNTVDQRIDFGNPQIAPEKTWIFEGAYERRLKGDNGTLEARGFYRAIEDHIDRGPFGRTPAGQITSAPINIDKAKLYGLELKAGVRLTKLGLRNAQVNGRYLIQNSEVIDPFTSRERKMKDPYDAELTLGLRHDVTSLRASYGATMHDTKGSQLLSDIRNLEYFSRGPRLEVFVEKALTANLTLRAEAYNLLRSHEYKQRYLYTVSQADGRLNRSERYEEFRDRRFAIRLRGKF